MDQAAPLRFATAEEVADWDALLEAQPGGEVWQSREYAAVKRHQRYADRYVVGEGFAPTLVLEKRVPLLGRFWYAPAGPVAASRDAGSYDPGSLDPGSLDATLEAASRLAAFAKQHGAFMLKIEPRVPASGRSLAAFAAAGYRRAARVLPNESTVLLDISGDEAEVMARFSSSTRTKIRRADKIGFETRRVQATDEHCRIMYGLLGETGEGRFQLRPFEYYRDFWQGFEAAGRGLLVLGYHEGRPVAGMFGMRLGSTSSYKDGASTRRGSLPNGAMYRLQWELILWGREHGATVHDLVGAPPSDRVDDESHPLYGVGQYKLRLSKDVTDYVGALDLPLAPARAKLWWRLGDPLARRWSLAVHRDMYY